MPSTKPRSALSLTEQLALLENPAPTDFDPEALEEEQWDGEGSDGSEVGENEGEHTGREHYVAVGKSKLRKGHPVLLDPKYNGAKVSRDKLYDSNEDEESRDSADSEDEEDEKSDIESTGGVELNSEDYIRDGTPLSGEDDEIDSDDALGSEEEKFASFKFRGSTTTQKMNGAAGSSGESSGDEGNDEVDGGNDEKESNEEDENENSDEEDLEDEEEDGEEESEDEDNQGEEIARRAQLRKMMVEEQKNVVKSISKAAKADADKGSAVRQQQKTFDSFLSIRIKLQKALISTNSLSGTPVEPESWKATEGAALKLWNILHDLRCDLSDSRTGNKRKRDDYEGAVDTATEALATKMHQLDRDAASWRETTLDKWSGKTQGVSTANLGKKLNNAASTHRPLVASIYETLSYDQDRLIIRTRTPRSMAPGCTEAEHPEIFDDADFYQLLLKTLVDRRMVDGGVGVGAGAITWTTAMRDSKKKKVVDTKASKGRKLRYQVQEKIQNFMAPLENNTWHEQQIDELFSSLLGQKVRVDEDEEDAEEHMEMDGLRLFRS
ncbi:TRAUB-domain-containing protein [Morchella conica CCBAS932]|uniref:Protein BFR2 n=1 Tax=Morchella conica CCBAS932 TaxID=1392247 RepID=A0A3N4LHG9_9PEZI|nr:TRAUB-domain-containing protein [Morchella conica CCBAS932]